MRVSLVLLIAAAVGLVAGAFLVGIWMVGVAVMVESIGLAAYALVRDVPAPPPPQVNTLADILERHQ